MTSSFLRMKQIDRQFAGLIEGNGIFYAKSLLAESDTTRIFGHPLYWQLPGRPIYQLVVWLRTVSAWSGSWLARQHGVPVLSGASSSFG